jgi:hypothetical protein
MAPLPAERAEWTKPSIEMSATVDRSGRSKRLTHARVKEIVDLKRYTVSDHFHETLLTVQIALKTVDQTLINTRGQPTTTCPTYCNQTFCR